MIEYRQTVTIYKYDPAAAASIWQHPGNKSHFNVTIGRITGDTSQAQFIGNKDSTVGKIEGQRLRFGDNLFAANKHGQPDQVRNSGPAGA